MKLYSIASSSSGNCILVSERNTHVLIDAGISKKRIEEGLALAGVHPEELSAILLTHEHSDHVKGLGVMCRRYHLPVYCTPGTMEGVLGDRSLGVMEKELFHVFHPRESFSVGRLEVSPYPVSHDAREPVAYRLDGGSRGGVVTDLGTYDDGLIDHFSNVNGLVLEANHDVRMLQAGGYPYYLKQRILSSHGHLSNDASGQLLEALLHAGMKQVLLGHLSRENNLAELALETVRQEVAQTMERVNCRDLVIRVASRDVPSPAIAF